MIIRLEHVQKEIRKNKVLDDINLEFKSGAIYGLKGKNGSGKTMMMRAICGLIKCKGVISIDGEVLGKDISFPRSIGALIENPAFIGAYSGMKNLQVLADIQKRIGDKEIAEVIEAVGLDPKDNRAYRKYSLGMKQRLGIAAAIMEKPDIIILDEPINALDQSGVEQVRKLLFQLRDEGKLIIVACHDNEELNLLASNIIRIEEGKIIGIEQREKE